ncbi:putative NAC domain-containing protein 66-like [Capsicum annuum]|nr:putative NAC domain-containing protein 66-like [Capsicum annuum]
MANKNIEVGLTNQIGSLGNENLEVNEEIHKLRRQMIEMHRAWANGLPPDTSQMATLIFEDMIGDHHLKAQDLVTPRAQEYARKTHFEPTVEYIIHQGHEWKIAWSIEDLWIHGFGHLIAHGTIAREPAASTSQPMDNNATNVIFAYLDTMSQDLAMENERSQVGVVTASPRVDVLESPFCDTLGIVRSDEDQTSVVGMQALVDPLDDEIDSPRENDLCPSSASTYNLTKVLLLSEESIHTLVDLCEKQGESTFVYKLPTTSENVDNDQSGGKDLDVLDCLGNPNCDCLSKDGFTCDLLAARGGFCLSEDCSFEIEGDVCLEIPSTSSLSVSYVGHIPSGDFETSSKCMQENPLFEVGLWNTFLNPLFVHDISNGNKEGLLNLEDETLGENESDQHLSPWLSLPFDPSNFLGCKGRIVVGRSTCLSDTSICIAWTLLLIREPPLCNIFTKPLVIKVKDVWLYLKCVPPWHVDVVYFTKSNLHVMRMWCLFIFSSFLQVLDSRSNPFQEGEDDTIQMATLIFEDIIGDHHLKAQDFVTPRAQEYARKTHFEPTVEHITQQGHEWKIAWSIEDLWIHDFGHLIAHVSHVKFSIVVDTLQHASELTPGQEYPNTFSVYFLTPQSKTTIYLAPPVVHAFMAPPPPEAPTFDVHPQVVPSYSTREPALNINGDQHYTFEPTFKLTGIYVDTHPPEFPPNTEKPVMTEEQEEMTRKVRSFELAMKNLQGLGGYKSVSYKDLCMFPGFNLSPGFKMPKFEKYDGYGDPVAHLRRCYNQLRGAGGKEELLMAYFRESFRPSFGMVC